MVYTCILMESIGIPVMDSIGLLLVFFSRVISFEPTNLTTHIIFHTRVQI